MEINSLKNLGLTEKEAISYLAILELGEAKISQICTKGKLKRTTTYDVTEALCQKGLVKKSRKKFIATDPRILISQLAEQEAIFLRLAKDIKKPKKKITVKCFDGIEGATEVVRDSLNYHDYELLSFQSPTNCNFDLHHLTGYPENRIKNNIKLKLLSCDERYKKTSQENEQKYLRQAKYVPNAVMPLECELGIYQDKTTFIIYKEGSSLVIENKEVSDTFKSLFDFCWDQMQTYD